MKNSNDKLELKVTDDLTVTVFPNSKHEILIRNKEVAQMYGVSEQAIRKHKKEHSDELIEGKHFIAAVTISNSEEGGALKAANVPVNATLWTKAGLLRLGFFIKSPEGKVHRDRVEDFLIRVDDYLHQKQPNFPQPEVKALPAKKRNNRLTPTRLIGLLADAGRIPDDKLRNSIIDILMVGEVT
jgi:hypothetical protein